MTYNYTLITKQAFAVTKSDVTVFSAAGFYVGTTGDVAVMPLGNSVSVIFVAVPAGSIIPLAISQVLSTGTSASNIVAFGPQ